MIGKIVLLAAVATVAAVPRTFLIGVDPNTLSCDSDGLDFLLLPSYDDCGQYYKCVHGNEMAFECPGVLWFDFHLQVCNWPALTKCTLRDKAEDSVEGGEGSGEGSDWDDKASVAGEQALYSGVHALSDQAVAQLNCAAVHTSTKLSAYRGDCQRYWRCNNGAAEAVFCSDGLYFNPKSLQCDFEANVACALDAQEEIGEEFIRY